jgi:hypothetical protein
MVLVSHIYKFIYLKNYKVAGSSVESFFGQFCINQKNKIKYSFQDLQDEKITQWGILGSRGHGRFTIWNNHKSAKSIKNNLGHELFDSYFKFCVVRNPYDLMVSSYFFEKTKNNFDYNFKSYCKTFKTPPNPNTERMFIDDVEVCNYYIRYENLKNDIIFVLDKLGITDYDINDLPNHKSNYNPRDRCYQSYYDDETKEIVTNLFKIEIEMFGYEFYTDEDLKWDKSP